ncbi:MAG TPA: DUF6049 family protein [Jatrophihabitans sp.]|nr:DUF6049 family protein [Jatrophihabitans sp.]
MARRAGRPVRTVLALLTFGLLVAVAAGPAAATVRPVAANSQPAVTVTLDGMTPRTPDAGKPGQPVVFTATLTNNTDNTYSDVEIGLQRGLPITQQNLLDSAIANPPETGYSVPSPLDLQEQLLPHGKLTVRYRTSGGDMCLCFDGVYPYALVASAVSDPSVGFTEVGRTQVFVPSFLQQPQPVSVAWVWPLLDRPHRSVDSDVFTDEGLAGEVGPGGRLDRALQVAEQVAGKVRLTLVVDPDLLDSLAVMARPEGYRVRSGSGTVAGTGGKLAAGWLARFKQVALRHDVALTAFADPDVNALTRAGLPFSTALDPQVQGRIAPYLNGQLSAGLLTWPAGSALTSKSLDTLVASGTSTLLLSDAALPGGNHTEPRPDALSPLPTASGTADALVTDTKIEATVRRATTLGANPANDEQTLLAQLAVRAAQEPGSPHFVVIAPDRYVDTDPAAAAGIILASVSTGWSRSVSVPQALATVTPVDRGALNTAAENPAAEVSQQQLTLLGLIAQRVSSLNEALHDNDASATLLSGFSTGIRRAESSAWRTDPAGGDALAQQLLARIDGLDGAVHLVQPADGTYSLSSSTSPIVVTVSNQLTKPVTVRVSVMPLNSTVGFSAPAYLTQTVPARSLETVRIPTHVERLGKFQVVAMLQTPDGRQLGQPVTLNVRATAIGTVTKVITAIAVAVLALALLRRLIGRFRQPAGGGRGPNGPARPGDPPAPTGGGPAGSEPAGDSPSPTGART